MSYITFGVNDTVYIKGIGYATLINCGSRNSLSQKIESLPQKKQSIIFDPDLFNSDGDSNQSKKSQSRSDDQKGQKKQTEVVVDKKVQQVVMEKVEGKVQKKQKQLLEVEQPVNIIQARLQGTANSMIFTSQKNVTKSITICVRSMLINHREDIVVDIEINRNIDTLKKMIFQQLGESINNYSNVKLFTMLPSMSELNVHSKTIIQSQIKDMTRIVLLGDYAFGFRHLQERKEKEKRKFIQKITNAVTITSTPVVEQPKKAQDKAVIALPPPSTDPSPPPPVPVVQNKDENKQENGDKKQGEKKDEQKKDEKQQKKQVKQQKKQQQPKKEQAEKKIQKKQSTSSEPKPDDSPYHAKCAIQFNSGRKYWQIKIQKLPSDPQDLIIGVCVDSDSKQAEINCWGCDYAWGYQVLSGKKVTLERDWQSHLFEEQSETYGYMIRQNETIGVLVTFRGKKGYVSFYKNSISCGEAFVIDMQGLKSERKKLIPFVTIGGESQITLDAKAVQPLDSFRSR